MREIILDEAQWVESALESPSLFGNPVGTLAKVAKYYHSRGYKKTEIRDKLEDYLKRCEPDFPIIKWHKLLDNLTKNAGKYKLIRIDGVKITKTEMSKIGELGSVWARRFMFAILCIAKYWNAVNESNNNWVNLPSRDLFIFANDEHMSSMRQSLMINDLWKKGYLGYNKIVDNVNLQVNIVDDDDEALFVTDFRNLGNQYMRYVNPSAYMECQCCGCVVARRSNRQKYCKKCADKIVSMRAGAEAANIA